jgi:hypothetical protein
MSTTTVHPDGVTGGVTSANFGFGEIGCINNYFVVKGDEFPEDKCDYTIEANCNLYELFNNFNAQDPDDDGAGPDEAGFLVLLDKLCECLEESVDAVRYTEGANNELIDAIRGTTYDPNGVNVVTEEQDRYSWKVGSVSGGAQKTGADPLAAPFGSDYTQIENQHFTFLQDQGAGSTDYYSVPRGGLFDKLIRIFLHCTSPFFNFGTTNYHQVSKLISQSFCEYQNEKADFDEANYTDIYHQQIAERIEAVINANNQEFRSKIVRFLEFQTPGNDGSDYVDLDGFSLNFCFDYRFLSFNGLSELTAHDPVDANYNNVCPGEGTTAMTDPPAPKVICLRINHDGTAQPAPPTTVAPTTTLGAGPVGGGG